MCSITTDSGVPNERQQYRYQVTAIPASAVPQADDARRIYEAQGGRISEQGSFGRDPLKDRPDLVQRRDGLFHAQNPSFEDIFGNVVSSNGQMFVNAVVSFTDLTRNLETFLF